MKKYFFLEREITKKESNIFYSSFSKTGVINPFQFDVKILEDNKKKIILNINTIGNGRTIDSLVKIKTTPNNFHK